MCGLSNTSLRRWAAGTRTLLSIASALPSSPPPQTCPPVCLCPPPPTHSTQTPMLPNLCLCLLHIFPCQPVCPSSAPRIAGPLSPPHPLCPYHRPPCQPIYAPPCLPTPPLLLLPQASLSARTPPPFCSYLRPPCQPTRPSSALPVPRAPLPSTQQPEAQLTAAAAVGMCIVEHCCSGQPGALPRC